MIAQKLESFKTGETQQADRSSANFLNYILDDIDFCFDIFAGCCCSLIYIEIVINSVRYIADSCHHYFNSYSCNVPMTTWFNTIFQVAHKGAVTCAVCPESAWLVTFLIGNVFMGVVTWRALRCGACGESGKNVVAAPPSKTAAAAAAAETWFAKLPLDYMLKKSIL